MFENERFISLVALFQPKLIGKEILGIHEEIYSSINKSEIEIRKDLFSNFILSGVILSFQILHKECIELQRILPLGFTSNIINILPPKENIKFELEVQ